MGWVEVAKDACTVVRIFKNQKAAFSAVDVTPTYMPYGIAVMSIREQVWHRCEGYCEFCSDIVTKSSGHMHEKVWRGKGGEISLENSVFVCAECHKYEHKERNPQFTRRKS